MPELPELQALAEGLDRAIGGRLVEGVGVWSPAALKTAEPPLESLVGQRVDQVWRRGKLICVGTGRLVLVVHLMQAGRLGLATPAARPARSAALGLHLEGGVELRLRELSTERRANAHLLAATAVAQHPPLATLGPEPVGLAAGTWRRRLGTPAARLHVALREGRRVAGLGRCYATEVMWAARLPPFARTDRLDDDGWQRLADSADTVLGQALVRARERISTDLPDREARVTAAHRHAGDPCLRCGTTLRRVSFRDYELVYCPACQTGGRIYADRRTSRFLR
jgi:formamidopyrimidine-DNA glycosylase